MAQEPKQTPEDPGQSPDEALEEEPYRHPEPYRDHEPDPDESGNIMGGQGPLGNTTGGKI
jgi:hypothetical protein